MTIPNFSSSESEGGAQLQVEQVQADRTAADPATVLGPQGWPGDSASYQLLFEDAPVGYMVLNRSGQIMRANHAAGAMLGLASGQLEGQQLTHWLHWQQHGQLEALLGTLEGRLLQGASRQNSSCCVPTVRAVTHRSSWWSATMFRRPDREARSC
ncbi:PAS domain-containing protein [Deinococcus radiophilus]|uniref:PAS domain-containing protein n=1 Tax=Deinococcus radiophilus TaxID=32062 RepID=UPI00361634C4